MNQLMNQVLVQASLPATDYIPETAGNLTSGEAEDGTFDMELTAGEVYDALQERLALARTRALMGEHVQALDLLRHAHADYETYKDALQGFPLHSLEHAFTVTMEALCVETNIGTATKMERDCNEEPSLALTSPESRSESAERGVERKTRSRKRASKAA